MTLSKFEREGERLGRNDLPETSSTELSSFENSEIKLAKDALKKLELEVTSKTNSLSKEKIEIENFINVKIPNDLTQLESNTQNELEKIESDLGPKSAVYEDIQSRLSFLDEKLKFISSSTGGRELQTQIEKVYLPFMIALAFAEVWVNRLAFELFFESNPIISLFLAVAVGAVLVFFAHITGTSFKRSISKEVPTEMTRFYVSMLFLNGLVGLFIFYLGKMREAFVKINDGQTLDLNAGDLFDNDISDGLALAGSSSPIDSFVSADLGEKGLFLILVNVVVYACGAVAAFIRHDSHPDFEKVVKSHSKVRRKTVSMRKTYEEKVSSLQKNSRDKQTNLQKKMAEKRGRLEEIEREIESAQMLYENYKQEIFTALNEKISVFRKSNSKTRSSEAPQYFSEKVTL